MYYSLWLPQVVKIVKAVGFTNGVPQDRTRALNTQRDLSAAIFLEDNVTLLDTTASSSYACTFVVTTTKESKEEVAALLKENLLGGPLLGLGSLRVPGLLRAVSNYDSLTNITAAVAKDKFWARPLFYLEALSSEDEMPTTVDRAHQQLRVACCCLGSNTAFTAALLGGNLLSPEELFMGVALSGYLRALTDVRSMTSEDWYYSVTFNKLKYWTEAASTILKVLDTGKEVQASVLVGALEELYALPTDRCLSLVKKQVKINLAGPKYRKTRKRKLKEEQAVLETVAAYPLLPFIEQCKSILAGIECLVCWLNNHNAPDKAALEVVRTLSADRDGQLSRELLVVLVELYVKLPNRPTDALGRLVLNAALDTCRKSIFAGNFDLTKKEHVERLKAAVRIESLLPQDIQDKVAERLDDFTESVAVACNTVLTCESVLLATEVFATARGSTLFK